jgi:hypothetical protein
MAEVSLLLPSAIIIVFGEPLLLTGLVAAVWIKLVKKERVAAWTLILIGPAALGLFVLTEEPWRSDGSWIVAKAEYDGRTFAVTQDHCGVCDCPTAFWFDDGSGMWRRYFIDGDMTHWRTAGFRKVASNRVDVTRFGLVIGSFDPTTRQYCPLDGSPYYASVEQGVFPYED